PSSNTLRLAVRDPAQSINVTSDPDHGYLDINGDGKYSQLDIDALALDVAQAGAQALWQNPTNRWDVNHDGSVSSGDSLAIINEVNAHGSHILDRPMTTGDNFLDVNGDRAVSMLDADDVIDKINNGSGSVSKDWQNPDNPRDANADGHVDMADV